MRRKWSTTSKLSFLLALVFGIAAFVGVSSYTARVRALAPALGTPVRVLVASEDLDRGTRLRRDMLRVEIYPSRYAPPGAMRPPSRAIGRTLLSSLSEGEVVTASRLAPGRGGPVASLVLPGMEAVAIPAAFPPSALRPGDRVDVLATFAGGRPHTEVAAHDVEVLLLLGPRQAAGSPGGLDAALADPAAETLVLLVTPEDADHLAYARAFADLSITVLPGADASM
jgi:Flp pilus assembly protein CpaB